MVATVLIVANPHANPVAFNAVLEDAERVDKVLCVGDLVDYNPWPLETLSLVKEKHIASVLGNHSARQTLSYAMVVPKTWLTNTSFLHLRHLRRFSEIISRVQANILVMEHTHVHLLEKFTEGWVINPGSVGQPRDMDPQASYAILDVDDKKTDLTLLESSTMLRRWLLK